MRAVKYAICNGTHYWKDYTLGYDANCWTSDRSKAKTWDDRSIPEGIILFWNTVDKDPITGKMLPERKHVSTVMKIVMRQYDGKIVREQAPCDPAVLGGISCSDTSTKVVEFG
jgi:hypothetical protein